MAHLEGKESLMAWFDAHNESATEPKPYWYIFEDKKQSGNKGICWLKGSENTNLSFRDSRKSLKDATENIMSSGTDYYIVLKREPGDGVQQAVTMYTHPRDRNLNGISGINSTTDIDTKISEAIVRERQNWERERQLSELTNRISTLEKEKKELEAEATPEWMNKLGTIISGFADNPAMINGLLGSTTKPNATMGTVPKQTQVQESDEQIRLETALEKLSKADPNFLTLLENVAKIAAEEPAKYAMYKPMIK